jgi:hypothetical protein
VVGSAIADAGQEHSVRWIPRPLGFLLKRTAASILRVSVHKVSPHPALLRLTSDSTEHAPSSWYQTARRCAQLSCAFGLFTTILFIYLYSFRLVRYSLKDDTVSWDRASFDDGDLVPLDQLEVTLHMHQQVVCWCNCEASFRRHNRGLRGCSHPCMTQVPLQIAWSLVPCRACALTSWQMLRSLPTRAARHRGAWEPQSCTLEIVEKCCKDMFARSQSNAVNDFMDNCACIWMQNPGRLCCCSAFGQVCFQLYLVASDCCLIEEIMVIAWGECVSPCVVTALKSTGCADDVNGAPGNQRCHSQLAWQALPVCSC